MLGVDQIGDQHRRRAVCNSDAKANDEPRGDKHAEIETHALEENIQEHYHTFNHDAAAPAQAICYIRTKGMVTRDPTDMMQSSKPICDRLG